MEKLSSKISALRATPLGRQCARSLRALNRGTVTTVRVALTLFMVGYLANPAGLRADSLTWNGTTDALWATLSNWSAGAAVPGTGNTATFDNAGNANVIIDLGGGVTILNINFATALAAGYTLGTGGANAQTLTLENGGSINLDSAVVNNQTVDAAVTLGQDASASTYTLDNDASGISLTINGTITGGAGAKTLAVTGTGGIVVLNGVIANGGATSLAITKSGSGALTLGNANTFTGGVTLDAGTLNINNSTALGTGTFTINGGTIDATAGPILMTAANPISWNGNFTFGGANSLDLGAGTVTIGGNRTVTVNGNTLTMTNIVGTGNLTKSGAGNLTFSGTNTFTGNITVNGGFIEGTGNQSSNGFGSRQVTLDGGGYRLAAGGAANYNPAASTVKFITGAGGGTIDVASGTVTLDDLPVFAAGAQYVASTAQLSGSGTLTKNGTGNLTIRGQPLFTGSVIVNNGVLTAQDATAVGAGLTLSGGTLVPSTFSTSVPLTLNADVVIAPGTVNSPSFTGNVDLASGAPRQLNLTNSSSLGVTFGPLINGVEFNKAGAGHLSLAGDNSASGLTAIRVLGGMLGLNHANALPATANLELQASTTNPVVGLTASYPSFTLPLGSSPGQVQITGTGGGAGFAAVEGTRSVNLGGGGTVLWNSGGFVPTGVNLVLGSTLARGTVQFLNQIDLNGDNRTLQVDNGAARVDAELNGGFTAAGAFTLTKTGQGALYLPSANATPGTAAFNINGGTVLIGNANAFGTGVLLTNTSGNLSSFDATAYTIANPFTLAGNVSYGQLSGGTGALTFGGAYSGTAVRTITNFADVTFSGNNSGGLGIIKTGPGTLTLSGLTLAATGANTVNQGILNLDYSVNDTTKLIGALNLGGGTVRLTGGSHIEDVTSTVLNGVGASTVDRQVGSAVLNMNALTNSRVAGSTLNLTGPSIARTDSQGTNWIIGGYATVSGTNWAVNSTAAGDGPITGLIFLHTNLVTSALSTNLTVGVTHTLPGALNANSLRFTNSATATFTLGGVATIQSGGILIATNPAGTGALTITGGSITAGTLTSDLVVHQYSSNNVTIQSPITGTNSFTKTGPGRLLMTNTATPSTYTGNTYLNEGTLVIRNNAGLGGSPGAALPGNLVVNGGTLETPTTFTILSNRGVIFGAKGATFNQTAGTLTVGGIITGAGDLTKIGGGTLTLSNANTFTGRTIINGGILEIAGGNDNRLGTAPSTYTPDHVTINGASAVLSIANNTTLSANRGITLGVDGGGLDTQSGVTTTLPGVITGPGQLRKFASGTLILQGVNTYTGGTLISNGVLRVNNNLALGSGPLVVSNGATFASSDFNPRTIANQLIIRTNAILGDTTGHGKLTFTGGVDLPSATGPSTVTLNGVDGAEFASVLSGGSPTHVFTKAGTGTLVLSGNNTVQGTLLINVGGVAVNGASGDVTDLSLISVSGTNAFLNIGSLSDSTIVDRIGNTTTINLTNYGSLNLNGSTVAGTTTETIGTLNVGGLGGGTILTVTVTPTSGNQAELISSSLSRSAGSTVLFRGLNLGSSGANSSRVTFTTAPGLAGGGGLAGSQNMSILPYAMADITTTGLGGSGFVTYVPTLGVRLLNDGTEYENNSFTGGTVDRNISLNTGTTTLTANQGINSLRLNGGSLTINPAITLTNNSGAFLFSSSGTISGGNISLASAEGIIHLGGAGSVAGTISSAISGANGLTISGNTSDDSLTLSGNNTFTGPVTLNRGQLILGSSTALGGINAGTPNALRMNNFGTTGLDLNGYSASIGTLDGGTGMVIDNSTATPLTLTVDTIGGSGRFDSPITQTGGGAVSLVKNGVNTLDLRGANTATGSLIVNGGQLTLSGNLQNFPNVSSVTLDRGATLLLDYGNGNNPTNRIANLAPITLNGSTLTFQVATGARNYREDLGAMTLNSGGTTITTGQADADQTSQLTVASLTRNFGATVNFTGTGQGIGSNNQFTVTATPTLDDGILGGWATIGGTNFVKYTNGASPLVNSVKPLAGSDYTVGVDQGSWLASSNVRLIASTNLTANRNINSLNIFQAADTTLDLGGFTLNVESGGIGNGQNFNTTIQNGTLTTAPGGSPANNELFFHTYASTNNPMTVSATIADNGGAVSVVKAGTGTLLLSGANTFGGSLTLNGGVTRIATGSLPAANGLVLNSGILASSDATARTFANPVTLQGSVILGDGVVGTGSINLSGPMTVSAGLRTITVDNNPASGEHVLSGAITGPGQIFKGGSATGSLTLTGTYGATGPLMVGAGTVIVKGASGAISTGAIVRPGATLTLDNTANNVNRLTGGSLVLGTSTGNTTTFNYLIDNTAVSTAWVQSVGDLVINGTSGTVRINTIAANVDTIGIGGSSSTLTFASLTKDPGSILDFYGDSIGTTDNGGLYTNRIMITGQAAGPIPGATVSSVADGTDDAAYDLTIGVYRLINYDTSYTPESHPTGAPPGPNATRSPDNWDVATTKASPAGGVRLNLSSNTVINQLRLTNVLANTPGYNGVDINNGLLRLTSGTLRAGGTSNQWIYGGALTAGTTPGAAGTLLVDVSSGITLKVDAVVTNNTGGTVSVTKQNSGTLELNAVNTYTGKTRVNGGTLAILADSGLGAVPGVTTVDAVTLDGGTLRLGNGTSIPLVRGITLGAGHGTVDVAASDSATIGSVITGTGRNLTKTGTGTLTLNRANVFSGALTLNGGTLIARDLATSLGAGTLTLAGGTLVLANDTALNYARNTTVTGNSTITSDRLTGGAGVTHILGTLSIGAQTLTVNSGGVNPTGTQGMQFTNVTMTGASTFLVNNGAATTALTLGVVNNGGNLVTFDGTGNTATFAITNTGGLRKIGTGTLTVQGASLYGGATAVENGNLVLSLGNNRLPTNTVVTLGSGLNSGKLVIGGDAARNQQLSGLLTSGSGVNNRVVGGFTAVSTLTNRIDSGNNVYNGHLGGPGANENNLALTKTGAGNLTLGGNNTYTGATIIESGTIFLGSGTALGDNSAVTIRQANTGGTVNGVLDLNGNSGLIGTLTLGATTTDASNAGQTPSVVNTGGGSPVLTINSNVTYNAGTASFENGTALISANIGLGTGSTRTYTVNNSTVGVDLNVTGNISGTGSGIVKAGAGTLQLSGNNSFDTGFTLNAGQVNLGSATALGTGSFTNAGGSIDNSFGSALTLTPNNPITLSNTLTFIGTQPLNMGAGAVTFDNSRTIAANASTLTLGGGISSYAASGTQTLTVGGAGNVTLNGIIANGGSGGTVALTKMDASTLTLGAASTYTGPTLISNGVVQITVDNALPTGNAVTIGTNATVGTLNLGAFNQTIGSLAVRANNGALDNTLSIGAGKTLTVSGNVAIGATNSLATTRLLASGGGNLSVGTGGAGTFQIGGVAGNGTAGTTTVDLSGLASLTVNYDATGIFRLGDAGSGSATVAGSDLRLPAANTITVGNFRIGDSTGTQTTNTVILGSGANVINANTINIGSTGIRSSGAMRFDDADTTGTLKIRATDGTSGATINLVNSTGSTGVNLSSSNNFAGHTADILASTLTMATRSQNTGSATAILTFDQGTLDVTSLVMGRRTSTATGNATATLNLGDSAAPGTPTTTIGSITMAESTGTGVGGGVTANLNITGGNVNIGAGGINMANAAASQTATSTIDITGGTVTVSGDIVRTGGAGNETATLNLNGAAATLDMTGKNISGPTAFNFQNGTLKDIGTVSSPISLLGTGERVIQQIGSPGAISTAITGAAGVGIEKTGTGTIDLTAVNTYDGTTKVSDGTLRLTGGGSIASSAVNVAGATGTFDISTISAGGTSVASLAGVAGSTVNLGAKVLTAGGNNSSTVMAGSINGTGGGLTKTGSGSLELSGNNGFTGAATVSAGTLDLSGNGALGAATAVNVNGGTLRLSTAAATTRVNDAAAVTLGVLGGTIALNNTGNITETLGALTMSANSVIDFGTGNVGNVLTFDSSSANTWTGTLSVYNWSGPWNPVTGGTAGDVDQLRFVSSGLTGPQLGQISFYSDAGTTFLGTGIFIGTEVVPTPEPATWISLGALGLLLGWRERRRLVSLFGNRARA